MMVIFDKEVCRAMASLWNALWALKRVALPPLPREIKFRSVWGEESVRLLAPLREILTPTTLRRRVLGCEMCIYVLFFCADRRKDTKRRTPRYTACAKNHFPLGLKRTNASRRRQWLRYGMPYGH
ncbi:MAG: hypothetical protein NC346_07945 [Prevotella sp.]|nr:hypothetical protein [Bacteroidales bacterium]MCM1069793.1 hypothetical protein [Prevotella sp.]MCM1403622.1 hypothetical protein [Bacteroides sp.]